ncbi:Rieske (2Fe-2S) protein [Streptomyces sp. NPDC006259]|uniref:Rieske (2Fe-2S) protein n=1 Tax=Streptomyces sp. NPDC006259 TaxID=3364740 RepID=UPI0036AF8851
MSALTAAPEPDGSPSARQVSEGLVLLAMGGRRLLVSATCPHRQGRLLFGHLDEGRMQIRCPLHHSSFALEDGRRVAGPACDALRIVAELEAGEPLPSQDRLRLLERGPDADAE